MVLKAYIIFELFKLDSNCSNKYTSKLSINWKEKQIIIRLGLQYEALIQLLVTYLKLKYLAQKIQKNIRKRINVMLHHSYCVERD